MPVLAKLRSRLTYANVMATVAVFIALGGTGYAAVTVSGKNVKNSSLTGADVKNSSLTSSDVKNRSLLSKDFKAGQLPSGPQGPKGDSGARGLNGTAGARGPSDGYGSSTNTLDLQAGSYVIWSRSELANAGASPVLLDCTLANAVVGIDHGKQTVPAGGTASLTLIGKTAIPGPQTIDVTCDPGGAASQIHAIRVDALH